MTANCSLPPKCAFSSHPSPQKAWLGIVPPGTHGHCRMTILQCRCSSYCPTRPFHGALSVYQLFPEEPSTQTPCSEGKARSPEPLGLALSAMTSAKAREGKRQSTSIFRAAGVGGAGRRLGAQSVRAKDPFLSHWVTYAGTSRLQKAGPDIPIPQRQIGTYRQGC